MMKPAFSTVACPDWTLFRVAERAQAAGFEAVELRTFGDDSRLFACDPAMTGPGKVRRIFVERGVEVLSLATGIGFDEPISPPVVGYAISDTERTVRAAQRAIDLAIAIECPFVRVFGFETHARESRAVVIARIVRRLKSVADHAHNTGIRIVIENGGGFCRASEVRELIDRCGDGLVGACYNVAVGHSAGDSVDEAIDALGDRLWVGRIKDLKGDRPCLPGDGDVPCEDFVRLLAGRGFDGPVVFEWDRAWLPEIEPADAVLPAVCERIWSWLGGRAAAARGASARLSSAGRA